MTEEKVFTVWAAMLRGYPATVPADVRVIPMEKEKVSAYEVGCVYAGIARPWERLLYCGYFDNQNKEIDIIKAATEAQQIYRAKRSGYYA